MNFGPPKWITAAAEEALNTVGPNHYAHPKGRLRLRQAIKQFYGPQFNRDLDINSEILVTSGANEGKYFSPYLWRDLNTHGTQDNMLSSRLFWSMGMKLLCSNHSLISICHPSRLMAENPYMSPCIPLRMTSQSQRVRTGPSILKNYGQPLVNLLKCCPERVLAEPLSPLAPKLLSLTPLITLSGKFLPVMS